MLRLFLAALLVFALTYVLFPHDYAVLVERAGATAHAVAVSVASTVRDAVPPKR